MPKHPNDRLQGTLDLLILKVLARGGSQHGYAIAQRKRVSEMNHTKQESRQE